MDTAGRQYNHYFDTEVLCLLGAIRANLFSAIKINEADIKKLAEASVNLEILSSSLTTIDKYMATLSYLQTNILEDLMSIEKDLGYPTFIWSGNTYNLIPSVAEFQRDLGTGGYS